MGDCPVSKTTVVISKVSSDGNHLWTTVLDSGIDNGVNGMVPAPDGGVVIAGYQSTKRSTCTKNFQPRLIRISGSGDTVWDRFYDVKDSGKIVYNDRFRIELGKATAIHTLRNGDYVTVFNNGDILKIDADGKTLWQKKLDIVSDYWAVTEDDDGGIVVAGPSLMKLDGAGNLLWQRTYPENNRSAVKKVDTLDYGQGFLMLSSIPEPYNQCIMAISKFDPEGYIVNTTRIHTESTWYSNPALFKYSDGYLVYFFDAELQSRNLTGLVKLDSQGNFVNKTAVNISRPLSLTNDNGYLITEVAGQSVYAVKMNQDLIREWECKLPEKLPPFQSSANQIFMTPDGGFVIVYSFFSDTVDLSK